MTKCSTLSFLLSFLSCFLFSNSLLAQPTNDNACDAIALTVGTVCTGDIYTNVDATTEIDEPFASCFNCCNLNLSSSWFTFVAPASGGVTIDGIGGTLSNGNIQFSVYGVTDCADFNTFNPIFCSTRSNAEIVGGLSPGTTYYIQVDGEFSTTGTFCIEILDCPPPVNDDVCNAIALTVGATCAGTPYMNDCSTRQTDEPFPSCFNCCNVDLNSVWFTFVAPASGGVTIDAVSGTMSQNNVQFAVYAVTDCNDFNTFSEIFCTARSDHEIIGGLTAGNTYYIQVDGEFTNTGSFCIEIIDCPPPANDDVCNAIALTVGATCAGTPYSNECALKQTDEPFPSCFNCCNVDLNSVWFTFVAPASGSVTIDAVSGTMSQNNVQFAVYAVTDCNDFNTFSEVFCTARSDHEIVSGLAAGNTYYIQVDGEFTNVGSFCLEIMDCAPPSNDDVCNAIALTVGATCAGTPYSNECAVDQPGEPFPSCFNCCNVDLNSVWFTFTAPASGRVTIDAVSGTLSQNNAQFAVYSVTDCNDFNTFNEIFCTARSDHEIVGSLIAGTTYYIQVDGEFTNKGSFCLEIMDCPAPANDDVCDATNLTSNTVCMNNPYSNECALAQVGEPFPSCFNCCNVDLNSVWFKYTATADGAFITSDIQPIGTLGNNLQLAFYAVTDCNDFNTFSQLACNTANPPEFDQTGLIQGNTYYIQADGEFFSLGDFCLEIWAAELICPPNLTAQCDISEQPAYVDLAAFEAAGGTAESNNTIIGNSFQLVSENSDGMTCAETITRVYSITDGKNYTSNCTQIITVDDTITPTLAGTPAATLNFSCASEVPAAANPTATDNCDNMVDIAFSENMQAGNCTNNFILTRTWTASDDCGNMDVFVQTITVNDSEAPSMQGLPNQMTLNFACAADVPTAPSVTATDNCDLVEAVLVEQTQAGNCVNSFTLTRTWTATDNCGNSSSFVQTITVNDSDAPTIVCPADVTIDCSSTPPGIDINSFQNDGGSFFDNCGINLASFQLLTETGSAFACPGALTRTFQISDDCNNSSTCTQTINIQDLGGCDGTDLIVNDNPIPFEQYRASNTITSAGVVNSGTEVEFKAGNTVTLEANFEVVLGGILTITSDPCN